MNINKNIGITISKDSGCYNNPHKFTICCTQSPEIIKAIELKGYKRYLDDHWELYICNNEIILSKGMKKIENLDNILKEGQEHLNIILNLNEFEVNVARELLK